MDFTAILFIGLLIFSGLALIATLIFILQPKYRKEAKLFSFSVKEKTTPATTTPAANTETQATFTVNEGMFLLKPIIPESKQVEFLKISTVLKGKDYLIMPQVRYSDIISINESTIDTTEKKNFYAQSPYAIADYVIYNLSTLTPIFIINTHESKSEYMDNLIKKMGVKIFNPKEITEQSVLQMLAQTKF